MWYNVVGIVMAILLSANLFERIIDYGTDIGNRWSRFYWKSYLR